MKELKAVLDAAKEAGEMTCAEKKEIIAYFKGENNARKLSRQEVLDALTAEIPEWMDADFMGGSDDEGEGSDEEGEGSDEEGEDGEEEDEADEEDETDD